MKSKKSNTQGRAGKGSAFLSKAAAVFSGAYFLLSLFLFGELFLLYYIKYSNQGLPLASFDLGCLGNILNLLVTIVLFAGLTILRFRSPKEFEKRIRNYSILAAVSLVFLIAGALLYNSAVPFPDAYLFRQPLQRIIIGFTFSAFLFTLLFWLHYVYLTLLKTDRLRALRIIINAALMIPILFLLSFFVLQFDQSEYPVPFDALNPADISVVLGAAVWKDNQPSPLLISRIEKAVWLYRRGAVKKIQLTGSNAPGELSEAAVARTYLDSFPDVKEEDILLEEATNSTVDQIRFIKDTLIGMHGVKTVIVISDRFHLKRIDEIGRFFGLELYLVPSDSKLEQDQNLYYRFREAFSLSLFWLFAI